MSIPNRFSEFGHDRSECLLQLSVLNFLLRDHRCWRVPTLLSVCPVTRNTQLTLVQRFLISNQVRVPHSNHAESASKEHNRSFGAPNVSVPGRSATTAGGDLRGG